MRIESFLVALGSKNRNLLALLTYQEVPNKITPL
jgi:hypothetical protein